MSRDAHRALVDALTVYLGPLDDVVATTRDWASATFTGMQHHMSFRCAAAPVLIDALPEIDLPMAGHFVADLSIVAADHGAQSNVTLEALTIREL